MDYNGWTIADAECRVIIKKSKSASKAGFKFDKAVLTGMKLIACEIISYLRLDYCLRELPDLEGAVDRSAVFRDVIPSPPIEYCTFPHW